MRLRGGEAGNLASAHPPALGVQDEQSLERNGHLVGRRGEPQRDLRSAARCASAISPEPRQRFFHAWRRDRRDPALRARKLGQPRNPRPQRCVSRTVRRRWEVDDVGESQQRIHDGVPGRRHLGVDEELGREPLPVVAEPASEGRPDRACGSVEAERTCGHERAVLLDDDGNRLSLPVDQVTQPGRGQGRVRERLAADEVVPAVVEERAAGLSYLRADGETRGEARGPTTAVTASSRGGASQWTRRVRAGDGARMPGRVPGGRRASP